MKLFKLIKQGLIIKGHLQSVVLIAENEERARIIAQQIQNEDNFKDSNNIWLDPKITVCIEFLLDEDEIVHVQYN